MLTSQKQIKRFVLLCSFAYFVSYVTRTNFGAVVAEIVTNMGVPKSALAPALTGSFITYGAGQLFSGFFGDRIHPKKLLCIGLLSTSILNLLILLCRTPVQLAVVWCINGFAQSFMWPPLLKTMLMLLSVEDYKSGVVIVGYGSSLGTIFVYLVSPLLILISGWRMVFAVSALIGLAGLLIWHKNCPEFTLKPQNAPAQKGIPQSGEKVKIFSALLVFSIIGILMEGVLRDGVTTWMPSYISETYHLSNEISILTGVLMPVFSIVCVKLAGALHKKFMHNVLSCSALFFVVSAIACGLLYFFSQSNAAASVVLSAVAASCMHGVNLMLLSILPAYIAGRERLSTVAGLTNSFAYIGSAISAYAIPVATEGYGWSATILLWLVAAVIGTVVCTVCIPLFKKKMQ